MPVDENGIGRSENTPWKHTTMKALWGLWCCVVQKILSKPKNRRAVRYIDLTAGDGRTNTFIRSVRNIANNCGIDVEMYAFERNPQTAEQLQRTILCEFVCPEDWKLHQQQIVQLTQRAYTFIYHDSNSEYATEHDALADMMVSCPYSDFAIHFDARQVKRCRCAGACYVDLRRFTDQKTHGLVRTPFGAQHEWTVMWLSNCRVNGYSKYGFVTLDSPEGRDILRRLYFTKEERRNGYIFD